MIRVVPASLCENKMEQSSSIGTRNEFDLEVSVYNKSQAQRIRTLCLANAIQELFIHLVDPDVTLAISNLVAFESTHI